MAVIPLPLTGTGITPNAGRASSSGGRALAQTGVTQEVLVHEDGSRVMRSVLPGGVRVLTESMPGVQSASVGFWVGVGSRDEEPGMHGSTHFLEHLLFKGTKKRSALDIALAFDEVGGESNAATAKESTCYYARVLGTDLPMAIATIGDMVTSARLTDEDLEQERGVILEELAMDADDPTDLAHERFTELVLGQHALGRPIGGTPEDINNTKAQAVREHYQLHYTPRTLVVTAAGAVDHAEVCEQVMQALVNGGWDLQEGVAPQARRTLEASTITPATGEHVIRRDVEQANVLLGVPGLIALDERRYALGVLNTVLGGGMSSRLFQRVREQRGLAYSTYSFTGSYTDAGYFGLYAGCSPAKVRQVLDLLGAEFDEIAANGITEHEHRVALGQLAGGRVLSGEDHGARMSRLGGAELITGEYHDLDETLRRIRAVTREQVQDVARELAARPRTAVVVGPFDSI
ncbi:insulinase family protein [Galactobacter caseinivorans]|uniref:Insulinase family protein n=2 Tax=Galactobacter caseinivorans TaxID=2676123 RepID=A0A496PJX5_9MICC|nr:insulinase family protein [Galactobacter caseinivorans]